MKKGSFFYKLSIFGFTIYAAFIFSTLFIGSASADADMKSKNCAGAPPESFLMPLSAPAPPRDPNYTRFELFSMPYNERDLSKIHRLYNGSAITCWADHGDRVAQFFVATDPLRARSLQGMTTELPGPTPLKTFKFLALSAGANCNANRCVVEKSGCVKGLPEAQYIIAVMNANRMASIYDKDFVMNILKCSIGQHFNLSLKFLNQIKSDSAF